MARPKNNKRKTTLHDGVMDVGVTEILKNSFLEYAINTLGRGLPHAVDGLKVVHKRILLSLYETANNSFVKNAKVVGHALGKYNPTGDSSVAEALARLGQTFVFRHPLVLAQGNFGSISGDSPSAMRYLECKISDFAIDVYFGPEHKHLDFVPNYDNTEKEPLFFVPKIPMALIMPNNGMSVGYANSSLPFNLIEVCQLTQKTVMSHVTNKPVMMSEVLKILKGPDFPTGGVVYDIGGKIQQIITTGKGRLFCSTKYSIEDTSRGRKNIVITEIPFGKRCDNIVESVTNLFKKGKLDGITDVTDETSLDGVRIVITVGKRAENIYKNGINDVISILHKHDILSSGVTHSGTYFYKNSPMLLNIMGIIDVWLKERVKVLNRYFDYKIESLEKELDLLNGLSIYYSNFNKMNEVIFKSKDTKSIYQNFKKNYKLNEDHVNKILDTKKRADMNKGDQIKQKINYIKNEIKVFKRNKKYIYQYISDEIIELMNKYKTKRLTEIKKVKNGKGK